MEHQKNDFRWSLVKRRDRKHYQLKVVFRDESRPSIVRSTGKTTKKQAIKMVPRLLEEMTETIDKADWDEFVQARSHSLRNCTKQHQNDWELVAKTYEEVNNPSSVAGVDRQGIKRMVAHLEGKKSRIRINGYLSLLRSALNFAEREGLIEKKPQVELFNIPKEDIARGRALTPAEIESFKAMIPEHFKCDTFTKLWEFMIDGILYSGFRIDEAFRFTWDDRTSISIDDIESKYPKLIFPIGSQKNKRRQLVPMITEMVELLRTVPKSQRTGFVFQPIGIRGRRYRGSDTVSKKFSAFGELAGIVVETDEVSGDPVYASAHDLRRTFADTIMDRFKNPAIVQSLMRHAEYSTTQKHYAIKHIDQLASIVQSPVGDDSKEPQTSEQTELLRQILAKLESGELKGSDLGDTLGDTSILRKIADRLND